ncbi:MAG TPA: hypothetical protein VHM91_24350, partial [Verrucomicrobiales bacterium]|nr:hypothetical protein [Verrucomicrobiales bacterium]
MNHSSESVSKPGPLAPLSAATRVVLALALPFLFTRCGTPKELSRIGEDQQTKIPVLSHAGHIWRATAVSFARSPVRTARAGAQMAGQR